MDGENEIDAGTVVAILVPRKQLVHVKSILEALNLLHGALRIQPCHSKDHAGLLAIPTNLQARESDAALLPPLDDQHAVLADFETSTLPLSFFSTRSRAPLTPRTIIHETFLNFLSQSPSHDSLSSLIPHLPTSYTIYGPLLLFPPSAFPPIFTPHLAYLTPFFTLLATRLSTTHIATNAPIPLHLTGPNILRSPTSLRPLHGDFGPLLPPHHHPTTTDFTSAFWTTTTQNGIHQVWAPRYTMFSGGNIREKTRLLNSAGVREAVDGGPCAAVDLYVGIGYFAFSYLRAGVRVVVGWDLNAWSVEGARRGAGRNRWGVQRGEQGGQVREGTRLVLFRGDNTGAKRGLEGLAGVPAVRHVNCGLLPSSRGAWETAVDVLDRGMGGWVHVHENFGVGEIEDRAEEVRREMEELMRRTQGWAAGTKVRIDEVFKVKTYAPGVWHCVIDIHVDPEGSSN